MENYGQYPGQPQPQGSWPAQQSDPQAWQPGYPQQPYGAPQGFYPPPPDGYPQQMYGVPQGGWNQSYPGQSKNKTGLYAGIAAGVVVIAAALGGLVFLLSSDDKKSPTQSAAPPAAEAGASNAATAPSDSVAPSAGQQPSAPRASLSKVELENLFKQNFIDSSKENSTLAKDVDLRGVTCRGGIDLKVGAQQTCTFLMKIPELDQVIPMVKSFEIDGIVDGKPSFKTLR